MIYLQVLNVQVPFMFEYVVDALSAAAGASGVTTLASSANTLLFATPTAVLLGYGIARASASACNGGLFS